MADLYFTDAFDVDPAVLRKYGAFDISVVSDLPMFLDPFLLFNSDKPEYQQLHDQIIGYLLFLKGKASPTLEPGLVQSLYRFKEVKQNWLGFTLLGNAGQGLGEKFARSLNTAFGSVLAEFGEESLTQGSHLEKVGLVGAGVGRDNISDFTTNLIKEYLLEYTQQFARDHIAEDLCEEFNVVRARFNYGTETWETRKYYLPCAAGDFVLLTPEDMLTRDDTWISHADMLARFTSIPPAVPDAQLRAQINNYFAQRLPDDPKAEDRKRAAQLTIDRFPELIDYYLKLREDLGEVAVEQSIRRVRDVDDVFVQSVRKAIDHLLQADAKFDSKPWTSYDEALERAGLFKDYVENEDGYRVINRAGKSFSKESEVQLFFGFIWCRTAFDVNREPNNGRGPVDFKVSYGSGDKSLIEFKLASSSSLKRNLQNQVKIYEKANKTNTSVKVIICYTERDQVKTRKVLKELGLEGNPSVVVIDARSDNKPSASNA